MDLSGIISISGKPGLYKVVTQTKQGLVVESVTDGKKMPVYASEQVSALEDISIYTYEDDIPLKTVFEKIYKKENGKESIHHKSKPSELREYLDTVVENHDEDRVYASDLKKLFQWYNILVKEGLLEQDEDEKKEDEKKVEKKATKKKAEEKKPAKKAEKKKPGKKAKTKTTSKKKSK